MYKRSINTLGINLLLVNSFIYISFSLYTPYTSAYYSKAGIDAVQIGILLTIGPLLAILIQPLWAILSDRTGRKKDVLSLVVLGSALSMFSFYAGKSFLSFFIASFLLALFSTSIVPLSDAISLRSAEKYQFDFSKIRIGGTIGYAVVVNISGLIVKTNPKLQFLLGFIGYLLLFIMVRRLPISETDSSRKGKNISAIKPSWKERFNLHKIFGSKLIIFILVFAFINQVGLSFNYTFLGVYMVKLGLGEGTIGFINCVSALSEIPVLFLINRILRKNSTIRIMIIGCLILGFRIFAVTSENIIFIVLSQTLHGLTFMMIYYSCAVFISKNVKQENQSYGQSILAIVQSGIGSIVGNIVGGYFVGSVGLKPAYMIMSAIVAGVTILIFAIYLIYTRFNHAVNNPSQ